MTQLNELATAPLTRECDCPEWVIRCAHFNGEWLAFHKVPEPARGWAVCNGIEPPTYLPYADGHRGSHANIHYSEADALAAFYQAERELVAQDGEA